MNIGNNSLHLMHFMQPKNLSKKVKRASKAINIQNNNWGNTTQIETESYKMKSRNTQPVNAVHQLLQHRGGALKGKRKKICIFAEVGKSK